MNAYKGQDVFLKVPTVSEFAHAVAYGRESLVNPSYDAEICDPEYDAIIERRTLISKGAKSPDAANDVWYELSGEQTEFIGAELLCALFKVADRAEVTFLPREMFEIWVRIDEAIDRYTKAGV